VGWVAIDRDLVFSAIRFLPGRFPLGVCGFVASDLQQNKLHQAPYRATDILDSNPYTNQYSFVTKLSGPRPEMMMGTASDLSQRLQRRARSAQPLPTPY
jgi:hypothetical protein